MKNKVTIIHRWEGNPESDWYPNLKSELRTKGFDVIVPEMPNTLAPRINEWVSKLRQIIPNPDSNTHFVGHSIGCLAILHYFETLPENTKVGNVLLVAPWTRLKPIIKEEEGAMEIAISWITSSIDWKKAKNIPSKYTAIFSTNDPYVYLEDQSLFKDKLNAEIIIQQNQGHFTNKDVMVKILNILNLF